MFVSIDLIDRDRSDFVYLPLSSFSRMTKSFSSLAVFFEERSLAYCNFRLILVYEIW